MVLVLAIEVLQEVVGTSDSGDSSSNNHHFHVVIFVNQGLFWPQLSLFLVLNKNREEKERKKKEKLWSLSAEVIMNCSLSQGEGRRRRSENGPFSRCFAFATNSSFSSCRPPPAASCS